MNWKEKLGQAKALYDQVAVILDNPESSGEDREQAERMAKDAEKLFKDGVQMKDILEKGAQIVQMAGEQDKDSKPPSGKPEFKRLGQFLVAVAQAGSLRYRGPLHPALQSWFDKEEPGMRAWDGKMGENGWAESKATMGESLGATGGFLVFPEFLPQLYAVDAERSFVRSRATIIPMSRRQVFIPAVKQDATTANKPHWFGGMVAQWTEEGGEKEQTDPEFRQIALTAYKLVVYTRSKDELLEDEGVGLEAFLSSDLGMAGAISWEEDYAFLQGTGVGQPVGVLNAGCTIGVARAAAGAFGFVDICNMMQNFLMTGGRGMWAITQSAMSQLLQLNGPALNPSYIFMPSARDGVPGTLMGLPMVWTEKLPILGQRGDILLANWPFYLIGDRKRTTIESTNVERFRWDETSWRAVHRVDGQPWLNLPLTLQDGTTQLSPFVVLDVVAT